MFGGVDRCSGARSGWSPDHTRLPGRRVRAGRRLWVLSDYLDDGAPAIAPRLGRSVEIEDRGPTCTEERMLDVRIALRAPALLVAVADPPDVSSDVEDLNACMGVDSLGLVRSTELLLAGVRATRGS